MLKLAEALKLPIDAATQAFAFIARKGAGDDDMLRYAGNLGGPSGAGRNRA